MSTPRTVRTGIVAVSVVTALTGCSFHSLSGGTVSGSNAATTTAPRDTDKAGDDEQTARKRLAALTVRPDGSLDGYDREHFPHWSSQGENCDTREVVLKRDGTDVETGDDCYPTSGTWTSPYDGRTWTDPSDVDIDHVVPLAEAWRSGASEWTTQRRERFANDLAGANLLAVTDNVNQSKGDDGPAKWKPPREDHRCAYAVAWIDVKHTWKLTVEQAEVTALEGMLDRC